MEKHDFKTALDFLNSVSEKKKFVQSVDLIINLKNLDLKQNDQQVDLFIQVPHSRGKKTKIACLCGPELAANAKQNCDMVITTDQFSKYSDKKLVKKLAREYDYFIAQANIMPEVAKYFGRVLGPRNKMPNPKAGAVVAPTANLKPIIEKLANTVRLLAKTQMTVRAYVGKQSQPEAELIDNAFMLYDSLKKGLPQENNNIKNVLLKFTMSKPIPVGMKPDDIKKLWDEGAKRTEEAKVTRAEQEKNRPKRAKRVVEAPKVEAPVDGQTKKVVAKEVWETDLDKPRVRRPRPGGDRPRRDKGDRR